MSYCREHTHLTGLPEIVWCFGEEPVAAEGPVQAIRDWHCYLGVVNKLLIDGRGESLAVA